jgi:glycosyltransferase involved in cell wall biosynthesis
MTAPRNDSRFYDAYYYQHGCGAPYGRTPVWLGLFNHLAEKIIAEIGPRTVLDAGCAMGFLVESLRDRGVEAFGVDLSDYAISQVRPDMQPFCRVGSVTAPFERRYDLIVCIEVLEHMPAADAELAVVNFCQSADDILFSSTPNDYREPTHFNVQPPEVWAELFARQGFIRDLDFDASFLTSWAARFRRSREPLHRLVRGYERRFWQLWKENVDLRALTVEQRDQLAAQPALRPPAFAPAVGRRPAPAAAATARLLIVSHEAVGARMSGPAIRYWQLAHALARSQPVTLAVPAPIELSSPTVQLVPYRRDDGHGLAEAVAASDVILTAAYLLRHYPVLARVAQPMVVDLYDPFLFENLEIHSAKPLPEQDALQRVDLTVLTDQLARGDFFICASEQQRDLWIGMLAGAGRVNPRTFAADPSLRRLIDVVPFGLPDEPPRAERRALKGVHPGIGPNDIVLYWGGGVWEWFDPLTAIRAVAALARDLPAVRLYFAGLRHPHPAVPPSRQAAAAQRLSAELGLTGRHVFFADGWMPYQERAAYLLDADVGLSLHFDHVETRFSFRTRLLDYIWAGLPMVLTQGDTLSAELAARGLARLVPSQDPPAVTAALRACLAEAPEARAERQAEARALADSLRWSQVAQPLQDFTCQPDLAADRQADHSRPPFDHRLLPKAWQSLRARGPAGLLRDIRLYFKL